jgi:hypothetical protein
MEVLQTSALPLGYAASHNYSQILALALNYLTVFLIYTMRSMSAITN